MREDLNLCQEMHSLGITCFGCCGHHFKQEHIEQDFKNNELQFLQTMKKYGLKNLNNQNESLAKEHFFEELKKDSKNLRDSGICRLLINLEILNDTKSDKQRIGCPLHESQNQGKDYRKGHCDLDYECKTFFYYKNLSTNEKKAFIKFLKNTIKKEKLTSTSFSIKMDKNELLDDFINKKS